VVTASRATFDISFFFQDSEKLLASNATLKEELAFVKREMNLNALRLMEDMKQQSAQTNCNDPTGWFA